MPVIQLELDSKGAVRSLQKFDNAVDATEKNTETSFGKMRKHVNSIGAAAMATGVVVATAFTFFSLKALNAASDMEETQGKFDVVFRNLGTYAEDAAERIAASYGMSNQESKLYLSSLQDLLVPSGLARDKAAEMSVAFTELAADLGSFNNVGTAQVVRDIQSALAGGSETMTKYGIDVKVAAVKAEMLALGLDTSTKAAERQSRTVALLSIMQRDSSDAMGDFARTTGSYANQLKIAKANVDNLWVALGKRLIPVATKVLEIFNEWITTGGRIDIMVNGSIETARVFMNALFGVGLALDGIIILIATLAQGLVDVLTPLTMFMDGLAYFKIIPVNPLRLLTTAVDDFAASAREGFGSTIDKIESLNLAFDKAKDKTEELAEKVETVTDATDTAGDSADDWLIKTEDGAEKVKQKMDEVAKSVDTVTASTNESTTAFVEQAAAVDKIVSAFDKMNSINAAKDKAGYDSHERTSTGTFNAKGNLSNEQWAELSEADKKRLTSAGDGGVSYDYFNNPSGKRFEGLSPEQREMNQNVMADLAYQSVTINNFNQQISVSDVQTITQQQATTGARA